MGEKKWGDAFSDWYLALQTGKKFVISLGLALSMILPAGLITSVVSPLLFESDQVTMTCGKREITISREDPIWAKPDPQRAEEMCDRAWGRS